MNLKAVIINFSTNLPCHAGSFYFREEEIMRKIFSLTHRARKVSQFSPTARKNACQYHVTGMIMTAVILALLCGTSWAEIGRSTVERAWTKIAEADGFMRVPINFEDDSDPNAWVAFQDEENFTVHVTSGLMEILGTEAEIAGVLGHELGHIRLGHYGAMVLDDTMLLMKMFQHVVLSTPILQHWELEGCFQVCLGGLQEDCLQRHHFFCV